MFGKEMMDSLSKPRSQAKNRSESICAGSQVSNGAQVFKCMTFFLKGIAVIGFADYDY